MFKFNYTNERVLREKEIFWKKLIGSSSAFPLESRIFHSISVWLIPMAIIYIFYNLYAGLYVSSISALVLAIFFSQQYYNSRINGKRHNDTLFGIVGILIFSLTYFSSSGIKGSTDLIWPAYLLLIFSITPYHQHIKWLIVYILSFFIVHHLGYYYPFLVDYPYEAGTKEQFIDRVTAFPIPVIATYIIITFIRRNHDKERVIAEEKAKAVELSKEEVMLQKDQLEESNLEKTKLMSIISHDLRAPLMNIQSYLVLLNENEIDSPMRPVLEKALLKSTNNAMDMFSNLLQWSKSQMEGSRVRLVEVSLLTVLRDTLEMERLYALKKDISLNYTIPDQLIVIADIDMLQLVVRNLISNAVKFTSYGGHIDINAQVILEECKITVSDNGRGIPQDKQRNIFSIKSDPEFGTDNERGVGLGLVLCKEFIERQAGRIEFESEFGIGSRFFVFIPVKS
jgi:two-component system sensor histidine kinase/response regulator